MGGGQAAPLAIALTREANEPAGQSSQKTPSAVLGAVKFHEQASVISLLRLYFAEAGYETQLCSKRALPRPAVARCAAPLTGAPMSFPVFRSFHPKCAVALLGHESICRVSLNTQHQSRPFGEPWHSMGLLMRSRGMTSNHAASW